MNKKELIIDLMRLDKAYTDKAIKLTEILGGKCEIFEAELFNKIDDDGKEVKNIDEIVLEYAGIPEDNYNELTDEGYCRDLVSEIYHKATYPLGEEKITIEKVAEILISAGENEGKILPECEKYIS